MNTQTVISLHNFSYADEKFFGSLFNDIKTTGEVPAAYCDYADADGLLDEIMSHWIEHNVSVGFLQNEQGDIIGLGGFRYLPEVEKYELICGLLPAYTGAKSEVLNLLINKAFHDFGMDRLCARVFQTDNNHEHLLDAGFNYMGERSFEMDAYLHIWNYYEIYNYGDLLSASDVYISSNTDWDSLF